MPSAAQNDVSSPKKIYKCAVNDVSVLRVICTFSHMHILMSAFIFVHLALRNSVIKYLAFQYDILGFPWTNSKQIRLL